MKRIFISFAIEDKLFAKQAINERSPFEIVDISVKEPWSDSWRTRCRTKLMGLDGVNALICASPFVLIQWAFTVGFVW